MQKNEIFTVVKAQIAEIIPELDIDKVRLEDSLENLGANSLDRAEITANTMRELGVAVPGASLVNIDNIAGLVNILHQYATGEL